jgi:uncharacterized membrane protein YgdD (TMEM256/DUF423 family)
MNKWISIGAASMAIAVALGAFGAHALRDSFSEKQLDWWTTAQHYQVWHALALVLLGLLDGRGPRRPSVAAWLFVAGTAVFSGTLYGMALGGPTWLGAVTPIGGASFIAGWIALAVASARKNSDTNRP